MTSIQEALTRAVVRLQSNPDAHPELEARLLLCHILRQPQSHLYAWPEKALESQQLAAYNALIEKRCNGTPIAYLTGAREFWSLTLKVTPDTLIPRPETELLVERALAHLGDCTNARVADLGTGSGAIAAALASERPGWQITATDRSAAALKVAKENFCQLQLSNITCRKGDWYEAVIEDERFDLIVSNPPYIEQDDPHLIQGDLPSEPRKALASGPDGLDDIRHIIQHAPAHLRPGGWLLLEHGFEQGNAVRKLLSQAGFQQICTHLDLAGLERVTEGKVEYEGNSQQQTPNDGA